MRKRTEREVNAVFKTAMLDIIDNSLIKAKRKSLDFEVSSFDRLSDMVNFQVKGRKMVLLGVDKPNISEGNFDLVVGLKDGSVEKINFGIEDFRCDTLERIACEVYDWLRGCDDDEFDTYKKDTVAGWFDTVLGFYC